jgi:acyl carrier protein
VQHADVKEAVVIAREDVAGEKRLVAYVTLRNRSGAGVTDMRAHLKSMLPDYMVPSAFVVLESLPLTPNGKLDRRALPLPDKASYAIAQYAPPEGEVEQIIAGIWQELLQVERAGREDDFFDLGGHSLLAMRLVANIQSLLSVDLPIRVIFEYPTLRQLSGQVLGLRRDRLFETLDEGGVEIEQMLEAVTSMPEGRVQELLRELRMEEGS